MTFSLIKR